MDYLWKWRLNRYADGQVLRLNKSFVRLGFDSRCAYLCSLFNKQVLPSRKSTDLVELSYGDNSCLFNKLKNYTKGLMVLNSSEDTSWHIGRDTDVGMTTCCQTGVRFSLCLLALGSLRGLVQLSARISTETGALLSKKRH